MLLVFPNTAGYLMHILESSSRRMPLARNCVHREGRFDLDPVDSELSLERLPGDSAHGFSRQVS